MVALVTACMFALLAPLPQEQAPDRIPDLTEEILRDIILFEFIDLEPEQVEIREFRQYEELGRARVSAAGVDFELRLICRRTDFGLKWHLSEPIPSPLRQRIIESATGRLQQPATPPPTTEPQPAEPAEETGNASRPAQPLDPSIAAGTPPDIPADAYQQPLRNLVADIHAGRRDAWPQYYFRMQDFNLANVSSEDGNPAEQLEAGRQQFLQQCSALAQRLAGAAEVQVVSFFVNRATRSDRARLQRILPDALRYITSVNVELIVDGQLGRATFEGLTRMPDGWRIGAITGVQLPGSPDGQ